ncbi:MULTISPECIES: hypothetical protein [unclassified Pseudomonas]|uniref:hypothetical protein n=1 Tax=unclassified Pseudomonas TaxID=196821 RepID=UPI0030DBB067
MSTPKECSYPYPIPAAATRGVTPVEHLSVMAGYTPEFGTLNTPDCWVADHE